VRSTHVTRQENLFEFLRSELGGQCPIPAQRLAEAGSIPPEPEFVTAGRNGALIFVGRPRRSVRSRDIGIAAEAVEELLGVVRR
jgi:hypothetical protein